MFQIVNPGKIKIILQKLSILIQCYKMFSYSV